MLVSTFILNIVSLLLGIHCLLSVSKMVRPQYTTEQRNFLMLQYNKRCGTKNFLPGIIADFMTNWPNSRRPDKKLLKRIYDKQIANGTVHNLNSKTSPGPTHSGRPRTTRTPANTAAVKQVMDDDAAKRIGDGNVSPVSSARRNKLDMDKSSWSRIKKDLRSYYKLNCPYSS